MYEDTDGTPAKAGIWHIEQQRLIVPCIYDVIWLVKTSRLSVFNFLVARKNPPEFADERGEQERRFLVDPAALPPLAPDGGYLIEDLYVQQTRLRLRKMTSLESGEPVYKFCKKYPRQDPLSGPIVNIYLSAAEYELLAGLPAVRAGLVRVVGHASELHAGRW